jgi:restriction system protein
VVDRARWRRLQALSPGDFEDLVAARLRARGYAVARAAEPDRGVDLVARRPGETVILRCVHAPATTVGLAELRMLYAALHHFRANRACLATTASLSRPAAEWAQVNVVEIWAGPGLASLAPARPAGPRPLLWLRPAGTAAVGPRTATTPSRLPLTARGGRLADALPGVVLTPPETSQAHLNACSRGAGA